ncbi:MAG: hypothetical protein NVSMB17_02850 [Candidatus Dormibacteria bacterium]
MLAAAVARQALAGTAAGPIAATYGFALVLLTAWAGWQFRVLPAPLDLGLRWRPLMGGIALAMFLLLPGLWLRAHGEPTRVDLYGAGFFLRFVPSLLWVAPAEELFFRGLLQPILRRVVGGAGAVVAIGVLFAAIHLPAYGWSAMPLDLGVGILVGWLREETGSTAACITAHTLADLGSWFLA